MSSAAQKPSEDRLLRAIGPWALGANSVNNIVDGNVTLSGGTLIGRGLSKGPDVARALRRVEDIWIAEGFPGEDRTGQIADSVVAELLSRDSSA